MRRVFNTMTLVDAMDYLFDLDYEASVLNQSTEDLLNKERLSNKISKDVYIILNNTLKSIKKGEIRINGEIFKPYEKIEDSGTSMSVSSIFDVDVSGVKDIKSTEDLDKFFCELTDWEAGNCNVNGTPYSPLSEKGDNCILKLNDKTVTINETNYKMGSDFNCLLNIYNKGIYLFKKINGKLNGVSVARWAV